MGAVAEGAAAFPLAAEAAASMDLGVLPTRRHRQISAAAAGRALARTLCLCHFSHPYVRMFLQDQHRTMTICFDLGFPAYRLSLVDKSTTLACRR